MTRLRCSLAREVLSSGALALLLMCVPLQLAAQEKGTPTAAHGSVLEWFTGLWSDLNAWFTDQVIPAPPRPDPPPQSTTDNGCAIDPNGGCGG